MTRLCPTRRRVSKPTQRRRDRLDGARKQREQRDDARHSREHRARRVDPGDVVRTGQLRLPLQEDNDQAPKKEDGVIPAKEGREAEQRQSEARDEARLP